MRVVNKTQNTILSENPKFLNNLVDKSLGLISDPNQTLIFKTRFGIHTFFLKKPIDVLILDKNRSVKKMKSNLKPWKLFFWNPSFDQVIELYIGTIQKSKTKLGDIIKFEE